MKIFVVVVTYNGIAYIQQCLAGIPSQYEVVVVDNNSKDDTVPYLKSRHPGVALFEQERNLGFGRANNIGMSYALQRGADYVFLLNQDAEFLGDSIDSLLEVRADTEGFGLLSPIHLDGTEQRLDRKFSECLTYDHNKDFYSDFVLGKKPKRIYEVPFVNAAGWLLSREILEVVGGFDPVFIHYREDQNYCQRLSYHGFKAGVVPGAFIKHHRVNDLGPRLKWNDSKRLESLEKRLKTRYGDINHERLEELIEYVGSRRKYWRKAQLTLRYGKARRLREEVLVLDRVLEEIVESRKLNKARGGPYLGAGGCVIAQR